MNKNASEERVCLIPMSDFDTKKVAPDTGQTGVCRRRAWYVNRICRVTSVRVQRDVREKVTRAFGSIVVTEIFD